MKRIKYILLSVLPSVALLASCNPLHIHDADSPYNHDETHHWQECTKCHEKFNYDSHTFNYIDDTCPICSYVDPIAIKSGKSSVMTGLTTHGKSKYSLTIPRDVKYIGKGAFVDSQAKVVTIQKELIGIHDDAFPDKTNLPQIETEEKGVTWTKYGNVWYKEDPTLNNDCRIDTVLYKTLQDALDSVEKDGTTITLLKDLDYSNNSNPITVRHEVVLEPYNSSCELKANFNITPGGIMQIPSTITYKGNASLELGEHTEKSGSSEFKCYTSGSLVFPDLSSAPEEVNVNYHDPINNKDYIAVGSPQGVNQLLVVPKDYYSYGVFKISTDLTKIVGLTAFGEKVNKLNITSVIKENDTIKEMQIDKWSFVISKDIEVKLPGPIGKIHLDVNIQKGKFVELIIGDGITKICDRAFSTYFDYKKVPQEFLGDFSKVLCPLTSLVIGDSVKEIGNSAFYYCSGLETVKGGSSLETIYNNAFSDCIKLKTVNFSNSINLKLIAANAFVYDHALADFKLPAPYIGWKIGDCGYLPSVMEDSGQLAYMINKKYCGVDWTRNTSAKVCYYNPNNKDSEGRCNKVFYTNDFASAYNDCEEGSTIVLFGSDEEIDLGDITINKSIRIDSAKTTKIGKVEINAGKYLKLNGSFNFTNKADGILLSHNIDGTMLKDVAGFAINSTSSVDLPNIRYHNGDNYYIAGSSKASFNDGVDEYDSYGLFDFNVANDSETTCNITVRQLSQLGRTATKLTIVDPVPQLITPIGENHKVEIGYLNSDSGAMQGNNIIEEITFGDKVNVVGQNSCASCTNLKKVTFGKDVTLISRWAFKLSTKLETATFADNNKDFEGFRQGAFAECSSLKSVTFPNQMLTRFSLIENDCFLHTALESFNFGNETNATGWKYNGQDVSAEILKNAAQAANYLKTNTSANYTRENS